MKTILPRAGEGEPVQPSAALTPFLTLGSPPRFPGVFPQAG